MNPGMLSTIIVVCIVILVLSGWNRILFESYSPYVVMLGLLMWMMSAGRIVHMGDTSLDVAWLLWICIALLAFIDTLHQRNGITRTMLVGHLFLVSSMWFFVEIQQSASYGFVSSIPSWIGAVILGLLVGLYYHTVQLQGAIITLSIALGEVLAYFVVHAGTEPYLGSLVSFDCWWVAFAISRFSAVFHQYVLGRAAAHTDKS